MVALGPVSSIEAWENRRETVERLWWEADETGRDDFPPCDEDASWEPPLQTLLFWSEAWRDVHGVPLDARPTVEGEAAWLGQVVGWAYEHEVHWTDFERDIATAKARLEGVLYAGDREERSKVPCIDCDMDRDGRPLTVLLVVKYGKEPKDDRWVCPRCDRRYDEGAFIRAQHVDGARRGTERFVLVEMAADALQVHPARVRRLASACDIATRSLMVWWPDIRAAHSERIGA
jgi:hypothetical protein